MAIDAKAVRKFVELFKTSDSRHAKTFNATVNRIDSDGTTWVTVPGGVEMPVKNLSSQVKSGDTVSAGFRDNAVYVDGNYSNPSTGVEELKAVTHAADVANFNATIAKEAADSAVQSADIANAAAIRAESDALVANNAANGALTGLSTVQDVIGVLDWAKDNATYTLTADREIVPGKIYWTRTGSGTSANPYRYAPVANPSASALSTYYEISGVDEAMADYINSHLALTDEGLYVLKGGSGWRIKIANDGIYIINPYGQTANAMMASGNVIGYQSGARAEITSTNRQSTLKFFNTTAPVLEVGGLQSSEPISTTDYGSGSIAEPMGLGRAVSSGTYPNIHLDPLDAQRTVYVEYTGVVPELWVRSDQTQDPTAWFNIEDAESQDLPSEIYTYEKNLVPGRVYFTFVWEDATQLDWQIRADVFGVDAHLKLYDEEGNVRVDMGKDAIDLEARKAYGIQVDGGGIKVNGVLTQGIKTELFQIAGTSPRNLGGYCFQIESDGTLVMNERHISLGANGAIWHTTSNLPTLVFSLKPSSVNEGGWARFGFPRGHVLAAPAAQHGALSPRALVASDIPELGASKITSGAFADARIPELDASKVASGTFAQDRIPILPASKVETSTTSATSPSTIPSIIEAASGATITAAHYTVWGKVAQLQVTYTAKSALAANGTLQIGTVVLGKRPKHQASGGNFSNAAQLSTGGLVEVRNISGASQGTSASRTVAFTYLLA